MRTHRRPSGLSLLELVVVVAIVSVLLALSLSAILRARDAASRAACLGNLRQIGLALHMYHDAQGALPPGVSRPALLPGVPQIYGPDTEPYPLLNWHGRLLPYVEQDSLWKATQAAYAQDRYSINAPPHIGQLTHINLYVCPSDGRRPVPGSTGILSLATTSYLGVSGANEFRSDGLFFLDSHTRFADITDGTSHTLMVGERPPSESHVFGRWYGGWGPWGTANGFLGVRETDVSDSVEGTSCPRDPYRFRAGRVQNPCDIFHFWSLHSGGANFLFADGSARFLPYSAEPLMTALASRSGGEAVELP